MTSDSQSIKFLLDEHMPAAILHELRRGGIDATSVDELRLKGASDPNFLSLALSESRVIVTRDSDFIDLATQGLEHSGIVFVSTLRIGQVIQVLALMDSVMTVAEFQNHVQYASGLV